MLNSTVLPISGKNQEKNTFGGVQVDGVAGRRVTGDGVQAPISCTPQIVKTPVLAFGIDTLHVSLRLEIPEKLLSKLDQAKRQVQETSEDCESLQFGETKLFSWAIQRTGAPRFPYVLKTGDVTLYLSNRKPESAIWNARLSIGSLSCNNDLDGLFASLKMWLKHYGVKWVQDQVSRFDLYTDIETSIQETGIEKQSHHVTRATTCATYHSNRNLTGVQIGKSAIVLRVYDKMQEMKEKRSTEKEIFFRKMWGKNPTAVTRVEFQLRREAITELISGVTDWESTKPALPGIFGYLVEWFRHTEQSVENLRENNNQHLAESSSFWQKVQQSCEHWREKFGKIRAVCRNRKIKHFNLQPLVDQATGCFMSIAAALGHTHDDVSGMLATIQELITEKINEIKSLPGYEKQFYARAALGSITF